MIPSKKILTAEDTDITFSKRQLFDALKDVDDDAPILVRFAATGAHGGIISVSDTVIITGDHLHTLNILRYVKRKKEEESCEGN